MVVGVSLAVEVEAGDGVVGAVVESGGEIVVKFEKLGVVVVVVSVAGCERREAT